MEIGKPQREIEVVPLTIPVPDPHFAPEPVPIETPEPVLVPTREEWR